MKAILTFHSIDDRGSVLSFPPATFARMIAEILDGDVTIRSLDQLLSPNIDNALAITFDDGFKDGYESAYPILKKYNVPAVFYLIGNACETNPLIIWWIAIEEVINSAYEKKLSFQYFFAISVIFVLPISCLTKSDQETPTFFSS